MIRRQYRTIFDKSHVILVGKVEWIKKGNFINPYKNAQDKRSSNIGREVNSRVETKSTDYKVIMASTSRTAEGKMDPNEFVNTGLLRWEKRRAEWLQGRDVTGRRKRTTEVKSKTVDVEDIIERIYSPSGNGKLAEPLPLGQIIDILIDFWEADGLYE